ncbi:RNA-binding protein [Maritimibacter sp. 55A14]|uniref:RNA-binding protein n=1 Tax=Maritimibacter sp. 55A14 TaxID=2174844 RepID=UPI000D61B8CD|nr:RNA-binding protein [Maritimibacter sp. 55A14]PWE33545.1 RNA-binding protein [Maritimibacter sp. 55A14]
MSRGGTNKTRDEPERRCIATGRTEPASQLIRFVVGPEDMVVPDILGRLPGRGIWVSADRAALETAARKGLFARAARRKVAVPPDLPVQVETLLARRMIELVAMARKAGDAVAGYEKVKAALTDGQAALLLQASDGSEQGKSKLRPPPGDHAHVTCLTGSEIGLAFGREHVIHAALMTGGLTTRVVEEATRLSGVRGKTSSGMSRPADTRPGENGVGDA